LFVRVYSKIAFSVTAWFIKSADFKIFFYVSKAKFRNRFIKQRYIVKKFISVCLQIIKNMAFNFQAFLLANSWKFKIKLL